LAEPAVFSSRGTHALQSGNAIIKKNRYITSQKKLVLEPVAPEMMRRQERWRD
jgi:hypothetical protein